jgi:(2Fe-2S) ferredoxin
MKARAKELGLHDVRINASGCLDRCELGPMMVVYPDGVWYRYRTRADVDEILAAHVMGGEPVGRLMLRPEDGPVRGDAPAG